jgi:hypothetical protein
LDLPEFPGGTAAAARSAPPQGNFSCAADMRRRRGNSHTNFHTKAISHLLFFLHVVQLLTTGAFIQTL